eukprot:3941076-Rhodomonas_salina.1
MSPSWPITAHASLVLAASRTACCLSGGTEPRSIRGRSLGLYPQSPGCSDQCSQLQNVGQVSRGVGPTRSEKLPATRRESRVSQAQVLNPRSSDSLARSE